MCAVSVTQIGYKKSGRSPGMTQGDGSNTKAQSYCLDQYRHIEGIGHMAICLMYYSVMKINMGNGYARQSEARPTVRDVCLLLSNRAKRGAITITYVPILKPDMRSPSRHNHFSDMP